MSDPITLVTAASAAPIVLKFAYDSVDFYAKVKSLRSPAPRRPLAESNSLSRLERQQLADMYVALERCRPVAAEIAERSLRFYLVVGGGVSALLVLISIVLLILPVPIRTLSYSAACILIVGVGLSWFLPKPYSSQRFLNHLSSYTRGDLIQRVSIAAKEIQLDMRSTLRTSGVSIPERAFLEAYVRADALVRVLECDLLVRNLRRGISTAHEMFTARIFDTAVSIISNLALEGRLGGQDKRQQIIAEAFHSAGLGDLMSPEYLGPHFFEADFESLAKNETALRQYLSSYISSAPRP